MYFEKRNINNKILPIKKFYLEKYKRRNKKIDPHLIKFKILSIIDMGRVFQLYYFCISQHKVWITFKVSVIKIKQQNFSHFCDFWERLGIDR